MLASLLEAAGYSVHVVENPADAVVRLERSAYDLVITDVRLGVLSLAECWAAIERFVELARPAPVGLLTGWNVSLDEARRHGAQFIVRKPSSRDALFATIGNALHLPPLDDVLIARIDRYFAALQGAQYDAIGELCTDEIVYRLPGADPRFSTVVRGRSNFIGFARKTFADFNDPRFEVRAIRPLPDGALVEYTGSWQSGAVRRELPGAIMFAVHGGRFSAIDVRLATEDLR